MEKSTLECLHELRQAIDTLFHEIAKEMHLYQLMDWLVNKLKDIILWKKNLGK